ncbi:sugar-transfer associated ATP-grasp domain-containing protein [Ruania rhizosphaerae]|uniref:sugar-transfer associated ATP-grasp domain-containing protein n=1 Tax=Ruania rhizosphaerae TaxID=1840413 RepID=UPI00135C4A20|nr:sugar-transfer associated ATP-grasp domain-containing protein [Ruania rhizosphaerae]
MRTVLGRGRRKVRAGRVLLRELRKLARKERQWRVPLRMRHPRFWLKGFLSRSAVLYDLQNTGHGKYVSDLQRLFRTKYMVHARLQDVINNKLTTHLLLRAMDVRSPELLGVYSRGAVHPFPQEGRIPIVVYLDRMAPGEKVFFKVLAGAEGKNIVAVEKVDAATVLANGEAMAPEQMKQLLGTHDRPFIVERGLAQHDVVGGLYPNTVNTVRVLTMLDVTNGNEPFIALAVQRIGCRRAEPSDNWSRGGLSSRIDLDTGELGSATRLPDSNVKEWFDAHPDTGAPINGVVLPYWQETRDLVMHAARVLSFMEYVGWDIVIGPDGPLVLEANINTGVNVLQSHQPLFADPRVRAYYAERGVRAAMDAEPPAVVVDEPV